MDVVVEWVCGCVGGGAKKGGWDGKMLRPSLGGKRNQLPRKLEEK